MVNSKELCRADKISLFHNKVAIGTMYANKSKELIAIDFNGYICIYDGCISNPKDNIFCTNMCNYEVQDNPVTGGKSINIIR